MSVSSFGSTICETMKLWKCYLDNRISDIKIRSIDNIPKFCIALAVTSDLLMGWKIVKLTYLNGLLHRNDKNITFVVHRKAINTDLYINWHAFAHQSWKRKN